MYRFVFALLISVPGWALAQQTASPAVAADSTLFSISVRGQASQIPDVAVLSVGVTTEAADSNIALRENAQKMTRVLAAVKTAGIAEADAQTSHIRLNPHYQYNNDRQPRITGYQASNTLTIKVRDVGNLGRLLDALATQGANQINGPFFQIDKPDPIYDQARKNALEMAQARAALYAQALGLRVRRIVSFSEGSSRGVEPQEMMVMAQMRSATVADAATPVSAGELNLSVNLDVVFELGR